MDEDWTDYFVYYNCTMNGKPFVFKNTHPTLSELGGIDLFYVKDSNGKMRLKNHLDFMIKNLIARYIMGHIFDSCFNGNSNNLPPYIESHIMLDFINVRSEVKNNFLKILMSKYSV